MHQHLTDDQLHPLIYSPSVHNGASSSFDLQVNGGNSGTNSGSAADTGSNLDFNAQYHDNGPTLEPPPPYEQSLSTAHAPLSLPNPTSSNPYLRNNSRTPTAPPQELQHHGHIFEPTAASQYPPSAPPLTLIAATSGRPGPTHSGETMSLINDTTDDQLSNTFTSTLPVSQGKGPAHRRLARDLIENGEDTASRGQTATSTSSTHSVSSSLHHQHQVRSRFGVQSASTQDLRITKRLEHKQETVRHTASAPELYQQRPLSSQMPSAMLPIIPLSQSVIPAPPPRLLQFRSRDPSTVPACPFLLCQKPIAYTKTRRERGVTVWIVCGLLFLCNTYWTTQVILSQFSGSTQGRVLSEETLAASSASGFSARKEATHWLKGFLGMKTYRYKDPILRSQQRHVWGVRRPTVATMGVVQDEQSLLGMIFNFSMMALMAIIRWWLCLAPLLFRPLFDTVHSCPHPHPYPYPEEIEEERRQLEEAEDSLVVAPLEHRQSQSSFQPSERPPGDGNSQAHEKAEPLGRQQPHGVGDFVSTSTSESATLPISVDQLFLEGTQGRQEDKQPNQQDMSAKMTQAEAKTRTKTKSKKNKLSWWKKRAIRKAQERRQRIIKESQDIGRYSLLYELGAFLMMDKWKHIVFSSDNVVPDSDED
ncbi:hypothetical protein BX616_004867 [Lobosporangium transversale]|uniref:Uncharacterized protein n=1 Tax=Lobosporangium transversale TaxID=64571 RepID=A0A1Y2GNY0_9FUNG|nr:hypothetical protein BCR41DRAFT_353214 [Lobosporangium transversale]KAF9916004.1 hypothetical protein BX616_004867 [Lobosporangium transversale]ORZ16809.1 hypothetical protein BCR41DRAFT_353214 [Lobosporangium transversale]|eukprot:XP_021881744.1 hypothetical protein BCR41DRAFT_353214 [Lobosporangium transversale]